MEYDKNCETSIPMKDECKDTKPKCCRKCTIDCSEPCDAWYEECFGPD